VTIAKAHTWLGQTQEAARFEAGTVPSESGKVDGVRAMLVNETGFDAQLTLLDAISATGELDHLTNALRGRTLLFDRFYDDPVRRAQVEEKIKASWQALPVMIRIALLGELAESALRHNDRHKAMELIDETQVMMEGRRWTPEYQVPLMSRLAALRHRAGDPEAARGEAEGALALFRRERNRIANIYRAEALRALAEAYWTMGDAAAARFTYKLAVEAGVENPNSRPRAKDLSATCCSMARHGFEPDAELWARLHRIRGGLGDPW
jgi:tetratricopeptide (TPR) repeat protein